MITIVIATAMQQGTTIQDAFLDQFRGHWQVERKQGKKVIRGTADCEWTLQHHYMRLRYAGPKKSKPYEADVSITFEKKSEPIRSVLARHIWRQFARIHWLWRA